MTEPNTVFKCWLFWGAYISFRTVNGDPFGCYHFLPQQCMLQLTLSYSFNFGTVVLFLPQLISPYPGVLLLSNIFLWQLKCSYLSWHRIGAWKLMHPYHDLRKQLVLFLSSLSLRSIQVSLSLQTLSVRYPSVWLTPEHQSVHVKLILP